MNDRLYRSIDDRMVAGVCGGIAQHFALDPSIVRIAYALLAIVSGVVPLLLLYIVLAVAIPEEPPGFLASLGSAPPPGSPAADAWRAAQAGGRATWRGMRRARRGPAETSIALGLGVVLVVIGLAFLVQPYLRFDWDLVWPAIVVAAGVLVLVGGLTRPRSS
ncbi:MAG TPA: PspC domain-containing protein [Candidatus Limnocylindrales bacterium]